MRLARESAEVLSPARSCSSLDAGQLRERLERALQHVGGVQRLTGQVLVLPPERSLAFVDLAEAGLTSQPGRRVPASLQPEAAMPCTIARIRASSAGVVGSARQVE